MDANIDHKALVARLSPDTRQALCARADGPGLLRFGVHAGLILALGWAVQAEVPFWGLLLLPQGVLIVFLFTTLHETIHGTAFRTAGLNRLVAAVCGFATFLSPAYFRYFHMAHHRFTQDPARDPELTRTKPATRHAFLIHLSALPDHWSRMRTLLRNAVAENTDPFVPPRGRWPVRRGAILQVAAYVVAGVLFADMLIWTWLVPYLLGAPVLRAYLLAEHSFCPHVANMLANTRTTFTNRAVRWIAWNMPYHAEHHAYPAVPFHRLPAFHALARSHLEETGRGYARFTAGYLDRLEG